MPLLHGVSRPGRNDTCLQQPEKFVSGRPRCIDDLVQRALRQISGVHRHDDAMRVIGMPEDVVAALNPIKLPAAPFQRADGLPRRYRGESRRHAATVTRSISTGPGIGSPWATSDSM